jgi:putative ABC transport system ATP-binding protein
MEPTIFKFILKYSRKEQILLLLGTLASFPFLYVSLDLPKTIINQAIGGRNFPKVVLGYELDQIPYLMLLCGLFLVLVFVNGGFKYFLNVFRGVVGERMLRRLRYQLFNRILRFPLPQFRKQSQGELIAMITAEAEPIGGFVGDSIALPAFQGGTLITILVFIMWQDWILGLSAIALYPVQAYLIPKLQRKVNALNKERVVQVRQLSEKIGEVVAGIQEVHAHDTSRLELADYSHRMASIYDVRVWIYRLKFLIKFLNNFIDKLTPFFFYSIGGYLVIRGSLSFGALVAVLAAYKDLAAPWKELLKYYQTKEDVRLRYDLLVENFQPAGMLEESLQAEEPEKIPTLSGDIIATNLDLREEADGATSFVGGASFKFKLAQRVAVLGKGASGTDRLAIVMAGVDRPLSGSLSIGDLQVTQAPESIIGRRIAYVGQEPRLRSGSVCDNLIYSLKHRPLREASYDEQTRAQREQVLTESAMAGNSSHDIHADWVDYEAAGVDGPAALTERIMAVLAMVDLDEDVYQLGLRGTIDPQSRADVAARALEAREALRDRLKDPAIAPLVDLFDRDQFNSNMTIAENLLFGTPRDKDFEVENLSANSYVRKVLQDTGLMPEFIDMGRKIAAIMIDLFADVAPGSELFEQYSFIHADDLPVFQTMLTRTEGVRYEDLSPADLNMLLSLPFKLIPARHRLGLCDEAMQARLLEARRAIAAGLEGGAQVVEFFDPERYNSAISIQDNILFGRLAYGKARSAATVGALIGEVVEKLKLRRTVMEVGLDYSVGIAGTRLSGAQRQKLTIARAILKRPDLIVLDRATATLDPPSQDKIMRNLFEEFQGRGLIWMLQRAELGSKFEHALVLESGKVVEEGPFMELNKPGTVLQQLVATG